MTNSRSSQLKQYPLPMVGSTKFGRYPKISREETWNMIISDGWLVPYAGYRKVKELGNVGRGIFTSSRLNKLIVVSDDNVWAVDSGLNASTVGELLTTDGDVFMDEDIQGHVGICDKKDIWLYDYLTTTPADVFKKAYTGTPGTPLNFTPGYIAFHDGRFIAPDISPTGKTWRLSKTLGDLNYNFPVGGAFEGTFQTKPDKPQAVFRFPGRGQLIFVMGENVTEPWYDVGSSLFPYQKQVAYNIDYGCLNPATIGFSDQIVVWLAANEKSGAVVMYTDGQNITPISTDGIDFKLASLQHPEDSYGFLFKQDGHLIYQITFKSDNLTYAFDFTTKSIFTLCDPNMNHHIAKKCVFFNNKYYFISFTDGDLYELSTEFTDGDGEEIPRIRITPPFRLPDGSPFIVNNITFPVEMGNPANNPPNDPATEMETLPVIDLSISNDGNESFGSTDRLELNPIGKRKNRAVYWGLGYSNEISQQFRMWGKGRFVVGDGTMEVAQ